MPITLSSRSVRRTALAGAAATLSIALAACGASFNAQTSKPYQAAEGTNADSGSIGVRNMLVLADSTGNGELHAVIVNNGDEDDALVKIEQAPPGTQDGEAGSDQPAAGSAKFSELAQPLELKAHSSVMIPPGAGAESADATGTPSASDTPSATNTPSASATPTAGATPSATPLPAGAITVTGEKPGEGPKPGQMLNVTITFGKAGPITTYIPVLTDDHYSPTPRDDAEAAG